MTRTSLLAIALFAAGPALAHSGAHLHPHDGAGWLPVALGLALIASAATLALQHLLAAARK